MCGSVFPSLAILLLAGCAAPGGGDGGFDLVLAGGRVMDPETGLDAVRDVGIRGGRIAAVSEAPLRGRDVVDARGKVVAPGFIDLHAHAHHALSYDLRARDGVTTALELEIGTAEVDRWYDERAGKSRIHHGVAIGHIPVRMAVMGDPPAFLPASTAKAATVEGDAKSVAEIADRIRQGLRRGAVAVGFGIQYTTAASRWEILESFRAASEFGASCHVHMRHNGMKEPNNSTMALEEVVAASAVTGAPLHVVHLHSTSIRGTSRHLSLLAAAAARGMDVTTECYPYLAGMTDISSGVFAGPWKDELEIDYKDLQWVATGERLTAETFEKYRKQGGMVAVFSIPPDAVKAALAHPLVLVGSDGLLDEQGKGHPRNAGTYARILGHYVREQKVLTLMEALRKCSLGPAKRLERHAPAFKKKGRVQPDCDADLVVFDPATVIDRATFEKPALPSEGISDVLVDGVPVVRSGALVPGALPGRAARAPIR
jgi:N-acyl-D-aspartate/D-glutamate deacylase